ncbi:GNAT family N-acetyltransferase [Acidocella sp.]|uniref:GNAT family N-acetyltransferase n=1 Tax=Acidocella sp. TaxID=50710 RepID=UPI002F3F1943
MPTILGFIHLLAAFEKEPDAVETTAERLNEALFGAKPEAEALIVECDGAPQAFAIWYQTFSTWTGRPGLYVEDVFVQPDYRQRGVGRAMFKHLAALATARGYARMEWSVLDWNEKAIKFYRSLGAAPQSEWHKYRLSGAALAAFAATTNFEEQRDG